MTGLATAVALAASGAAWGQGELESDQQKLGYTVGMQIGHSLRTDQLDIDLDALSLGIRDVMTGQDPRLTEDEMMAVVERLQAERMAEQEQVAEENLKESQTFLEENARRSEVQQTPSGLQYEVRKEGSGKKPESTDAVVVHYRGMLIDGTEFDSSYRRGEPVSFHVNEVINGWQEALPMMSEGAEWRIYIPSDLAYGSRGAGQDIPPNSALIFDIELLSVESP